MAKLAHSHPDTDAPELPKPHTGFLADVVYTLVFIVVVWAIGLAFGVGACVSFAAIVLTGTYLWFALYRSRKSHERNR